MPQPLPAPPDYLAGYRAEQERSKADMNQRAAYAAAIAESLGHYTPELQQEVLAPMGKYPTMGEYLFGAPIRGLGKLFGSESMQRAGAPQQFQLTGQPEAPPVMPPLPAGVPEDMRQFLQQYATSKGYIQQPQRQITTNMPSEYSTSQPMLKTKTEREAEAAAQKNFWDMIGKTYKSEQEQEMTKAQIANYQAQEQHFKQLDAESKEKLTWGPTASEWSILNDVFKQHPELDKLKTLREFTQLMKSGRAETAELQLFREAQRTGYKGNLAQFRSLMTKAKFDPARIAYETFYSDPIAAREFSDPVERDAELQRRTLEYTRLMDAMNTGEWGALGSAAPAPGKGKGKSSVSGQWALQQYGGQPIPKEEIPKPAQGKKPPANAIETYDPQFPIPKELLVQGVRKTDIELVMAAKGINQSQAVEMLMNFYRSKKEGR